MPSGKVHATATISLAVVTSLAGGMLHYTGVSWVVVGELVGLAVTPDLDLTEARRGRVGFWGGVWRMFWWPYGKMFHHRATSHAPIIGTMTRLFYIGVLLIVLEIAGVRTEWLLKSQVVFMVAGLMLADLLHILMDSL